MSRRRLRPPEGRATSAPAPLTAPAPRARPECRPAQRFALARPLVHAADRADGVPAGPWRRSPSCEQGFEWCGFVQPGAVHRANGGFLLLDVRHLLMEPFSWTALKRTLRQGEIRIEDVGRFIGLTSTVSLEPDPVPLDVKVVLFGSRLLYYLLVAFDPEVSEHFKVLADFEDEVDRSPESEALHAGMIASIVTRDRLKPIDRDGVALVLEHAARLADHADKLTLLIDQIRDVLAEADYWAADEKRVTITREDIQHALDQKIRRASRMRDRAQEAILQDVALIDTSGSCV